MPSITTMFVPDTSPTVPGGPTGPQWTAATQDITRIDSRVFDVTGHGAVGDGVTDDHAAIQWCLDNLPDTVNDAQGGKVVLPPGRVYAVSETLEITHPNTDLDGLVGGTLATRGACTIKALPGFTGPLIRVSIPDGDKGAWLRNLKLDGNGVAGVTAGIEYATGTISVAHTFDVAIINVPIGLDIKYHAQSLIFERVIAFYNVGTAVNIVGKAYQILFDKCRMGGTSWCAVVGADNNVGADHCEMVMFNDCELYGRNGASGVVWFRNVENPRLTNCYIEAEGPMTALVRVGSSNTGAVPSPIFTGNRFGCNSHADHGVEIIKAFAPYIMGNGCMDALVSPIKETMANTGGMIAGAGSGWVGRMLSAIESLPANEANDAFRVFAPGGEPYPRLALRAASGGTIEMGGGWGAGDTIIRRWAANVAEMGAGDSFKLDGTHNGGRLILRGYHIWVDATGDLRISNGAPASDTAGTVIGTQT